MISKILLEWPEVLNKFPGVAEAQNVCKASRYFYWIFNILLEWLEVLDKFSEVVEAPECL